MADALMTTNLPFPVRRGKVRDVYDVGTELLIVATDRISAFDCVMPNGIPDKGKILTQLSVFWFQRLANLTTHHLLEWDVAGYSSRLRPFAEQLRGRSMLVEKAEVIPIECVARGYLAGSGWKEYRDDGTVCGIKLPPGLRQCDKLPEPIFTPATKESSGHDINITFAQAGQRIGVARIEELRRQTLLIYKEAADYARSRGIIIADTKFEFGLVDDDRLLLVDEILTPDSSRFWPADQYEAGRDQESFDKQYVRNWLENQPWDKTPPAPTLPDDVVQGTRRRYLDAYERLTGESWET